MAHDNEPGHGRVPTLQSSSGKSAARLGGEIGLAHQTQGVCLLHLCLCRGGTYTYTHLRTGIFTGTVMTAS